MNIIMIGLAKELPEHDEAYELHRLLGALLSRELTVDEKLLRKKVSQLGVQRVRQDSLQKCIKTVFQ